MLKARAVTCRTCTLYQLITSSAFSEPLLGVFLVDIQPRFSYIQITQKPVLFFIFHRIGEDHQLHDGFACETAECDHLMMRPVNWEILGVICFKS